MDLSDIEKLGLDPFAVDKFKTISEAINGYRNLVVDVLRSIEFGSVSIPPREGLVRCLL
jgi:hypothetical protein